jgi:uracil-DNA glycosylase
MLLVSFYNYVQVLLASSRTRPTREDWASGRDPFLAVLGRLTPDVVLVLGMGVWWHLPGAIPPGPDGSVEAGGLKRRTRRITLANGHTTVLGSLPHPSWWNRGRLTQSMARAWVDKFIETVELG